MRARWTIAVVALLPVVPVVSGVVTAAPAAAACAAPSFGAPTSFAAVPGTLASADYDVDGKPDIAVGDQLLYGDGTGGFGAPNQLLNVRAISAVDLGGVTPPISGVNNAAPELVAESRVTNRRVVVGLGTGDRSSPFSLLAGFPVSTGTPISAAAADLTGDGIPDLVLGYGFPADKIVIWKGASLTPNWGSEVVPIEIPFGAPVALVTADFDGDGTAELAAVSHGGALVDFNYRNGAFVRQDLALAGGPTGLAVADLNGDGFLDAVMPTSDGHVVTSLGRGDQLVQNGNNVLGTAFGAPTAVNVGGQLAGVALGDLNGDQRTDAAVVDATGQQVVPLIGNGAGGFTAAAGLPTGTANPTSVALADLNGDGALDIISGDETDPNIVVRRNTCPTSPVDISITGVEVTQGIQDLSNSVALIAGRKTFVRVHVKAGTAIDGVTARLTRTDSSGTPIDRPLWPENPNGRITVKTNPDRQLINDSFYFELPASWSLGAPLTFKVDVNPDHLPVETDTANNTAVRTVAFATTNPLKIEFIKIKFTWAAGDGTDCGRSHEPTNEDLDAAESALRRSLPASNFVITRQADVWDSGLTLGCTVVTGPDGDIKTILTKFKDAFVSLPRDRIRLGIFDRQPLGGVADDFGGWFAVSQSKSPDIVVHEIGHDLGRMHVVSPLVAPCNASMTPAGLDNTYPYPDGRIGGTSAEPDRFMGFDPGDASIGLFPPPRRVVAPDTGDTMTYCRDRWPSDYTWAAERANINGRFSPTDPTGDFLSVTGTVNPAGTTVTDLTAVRRSQLGALEPVTPGTFHLRLLDVGGGVLSDTPFSPRLDHDGTPTILDSTINFVVGARKLVIVNPSGTVIGSRAISANAPTVSNVTLSSGNTIPSSGPVTVSWTASDLDGDPLLADVLWSHDGGTTFEPVAGGVSGSSYTLDASRFAGTHGQPTGVVRVFVRDPILTGFGDDGGIAAGGSGPRLRIGAPFGGQAFIRGQNIGLTAYATDTEDGKLDGAVTWSSNLDGPLGTGGDLSVLLSAGAHVLTARVVDGDGNVATATRTVQVFGILPAGGPPVADAGPDQNVNEGATVTLNGTGSHDPDGDPLTYSWQLIQAPFDLTSVPLRGAPATPSFVAVEAGTYQLALTVSDQRQGSSTAIVTIHVTTPPPALDQIVTVNETTAVTPLVSPPISTVSGNELVLAFVSMDGPPSPSQTVTGVTGGGLTWTLAGRANAAWGTAEVWQAYATSPLNAAVVKATLAQTRYDGTMTVATFTGAAPTVGATAIGAAIGTPGVTLTTTKPNSLVWAVGHDWSTATMHAPNIGQSIVRQFLDTRVGDTSWTQSTDAPVAGVGSPVNVGDSVPTNDRWDLTAVEITPATQTLPFGADKIRTTDQIVSSPTFVAPPVTTTASNELVLAFVSTDGPMSSQQQVAGVTGGGLNWSLAARANSVLGSAEVWQAFAVQPLNQATIAATLKTGSYHGTITVITYTHAADLVGSVATGGATTGAPNVAITTSTAGSRVWAVGHDWDHAVAHPPIKGQMLVNVFLDTTVHDTSWVQQTGSLPPLTIGVGNTAPTTDRWDLAAVEVVPENPGVVNST